MRKLFYNLTITSVSVLGALVVGGIETLGLIAGQFQLHGAFWNAISDLNGNFGALGYGSRCLSRVGYVVFDLPLQRYDLNPALDRAQSPIS
jgi:nickel/cobalt transporter (NiCoT) family protein